MKKVLLAHLLGVISIAAFAQPDVDAAKNQQAALNFTVEKSIAATPVKNQAMTGTCWCFSSTSLIESQCLRKNLGEMDLSEMYTVRNIYIEKAKNYVLRQGHAQFGEGGLGHDLIRAIATYGAVPESVYSGLKPGETMHNHQHLATYLKHYLDSVLRTSPLSADWLEGYTKVLDASLGTPPEGFIYKGKKYTPKTFAAEVLKFDANEYVNLTSFTHHPYYTPFIIEVPDNFSNGSYYNLPLNELIQVTKDALKGGYSVLWDADVSNNGFKQNLGIAEYYDNTLKPTQKSKLEAQAADANQLPAYATQQVSDAEMANPGINAKKAGDDGKMAAVAPAEGKWDANIRQALFENLTTQDDHLMHITGIERNPQGKTYFLVKNSWGDIGPAHGYINVSEAYFAINTISLIIPKAAISKELLSKLGIK